MRKIAIITPVFNTEYFIDECIDSVKDLVLGNFEVEHIVVDDGSTDTSWEIIDKRRYSKMKAFRLNKNMGGSYARNYGVKKSDADLIFCLDADDVIFQNSILHLAEFMEKNDHDWVYGDFLRSNYEMKYLIGQDYYGYKFLSIPEVLTSMFSGEHFFQQNCLYTRKLFDSVGGFDESSRHFQDFNLFTRFLLNDHMPQYLSGALYLHRNHSRNLSKLNNRETDPELHRKDVKDLFFMYEKKILKKLSSKQIDKILSYING